MHVKDLTIFPFCQHPQECRSVNPNRHCRKCLGQRQSSDTESRYEKYCLNKNKCARSSHTKRPDSLCLDCARQVNRSKALIRVAKIDVPKWVPDDLKDDYRLMTDERSEFYAAKAIRSVLSKRRADVRS